MCEWAGQLRTTDISKGGHRFAHHTHIQTAAAPIFKQLAEEKHLAGLTIMDENHALAAPPSNRLACKRNPSHDNCGERVGRTSGNLDPLEVRSGIVT